MNTRNYDGEIQALCKRFNEILRCNGIYNEIRVYINGKQRVGTVTVTYFYITSQKERTLETMTKKEAIAYFTGMHNAIELMKNNISSIWER